MSAPLPDGPVTLRAVRPLGGAAVDIRVWQGQVERVNPPGTTEAAGREIDGSGLIVLPGLVDLHTHLREPGGESAETIATGTRAAAAGGFTDVFAMANTNPVCDRIERLADLRARIARSAVVRVHPISALSVGLEGAQLVDMAAMADAGVRVFSDDGHCLDDSALMYAALGFAARRGVVVAQHAQDAGIAGGGQVNEGLAATEGLAAWPAAGEEAIIARDAVLAGRRGAHLHVCHVSTAGSVEILRWAKERGWSVTAEVTPHHLVLTDQSAEDHDPRFKVNPPLRSPADVHALRAALRDGTIDAVATDHAPHPDSSKTCSWETAAFGMTGLETAVAVVADVLGDGGDTDWHRLAEVMAFTPARIGGLDSPGPSGWPRQGTPATFCLVDDSTTWTAPEPTWTSRSANSPFAGSAFTHRVVATVLDGRIVHSTAAFDRRAPAAGAPMTRTTR